MTDSLMHTADPHCCITFFSPSCKLERGSGKVTRAEGTGSGGNEEKAENIRKEARIKEKSERRNGKKGRKLK